MLHFILSSHSNTLHNFNLFVQKEDIHAPLRPLNEIVGKRCVRHSETFVCVCAMDCWQIFSWKQQHSRKCHCIALHLKTFPTNKFTIPHFCMSFIVNCHSMLDILTILLLPNDIIFIHLQCVPINLLNFVCS